MIRSDCHRLVRALKREHKRLAAFVKAAKETATADPTAERLQAVADLGRELRLLEDKLVQAERRLEREDAEKAATVEREERVRAKGVEEVAAAAAAEGPLILCAEGDWEEYSAGEEARRCEYCACLPDSAGNCGCEAYSRGEFAPDGVGVPQRRHVMCPICNSKPCSCGAPARVDIGWTGK